MPVTRKVPRPFEMMWGSGEIVEVLVGEDRLEAAGERWCLGRHGHIEPSIDTARTGCGRDPQPVEFEQHLAVRHRPIVPCSRGTCSLRIAESWVERRKLQLDDGTTTEPEMVTWESAQERLDHERELGGRGESTQGQDAEIREASQPASGPDMMTSQSDSEGD